MKNIVHVIAVALLLQACASGSSKNEAQKESDANSYTQVNLVANRAEFKPAILEPDMQNAWGLANRPAGLGGHFWVTTQKTGKSIQYVGDVGGKPLFQDDLKVVNLVEGEKPSTPTGVVFNPSTKFVIDQPSPEGNFKSESKFMFVTDSGKIYAWAEKKKEDGKFNRPAQSVLKADHTKRGDQYFGLGINSAGDRLYVSDFGTKPQMRMFDTNFKEMKLKPGQFKNPFIKGKWSQGGEYAPYNVQVFKIGDQERVFVAYAMIDKDKKGKIEAGEEMKGAGLGRIVEYDLDGKLIKVWNDKGMLNAPWGFSVAPHEGFGKFSGFLLVGNFGDGAIVAFDPKTQEAVEYLKQADGTPIKIDGLWGLMFGNGASLGEKDQLYFAAGPNDEVDGIFGKIKINR